MATSENKIGESEREREREREWERKREGGVAERAFDHAPSRGTETHYGGLIQCSII